MKSNKPERLFFNRYYHIYNRGTNSCEIFYERQNYEHFLRLIEKYIMPIAELYAWALHKNHFHIMVKIKSEKEILKYQKESKLSKMSGEDRIYQQFSNLFNAYTKAFNKKYKRTGSLFEHPFERKRITGKKYFKRVILYIHTNPIKHLKLKHPIEYPWTSFIFFMSDARNFVDKKKVLKWFSSFNDFKKLHNEMTELIHTDELQSFPSER